MTSVWMQQLGLQLPVVQGPMTGADSPALAAAVSAAGGLGSLGCGMRSPQAMAEAAAAVRAQTDRPFAMNLFVQATPTPEAATVQQALQRLAPLYARFGAEPALPAQWCEDFGQQLDALVACRPAVASFTFGILSAAQVQRLHGAGCQVWGTATTVAEALAWQTVGADAVIASGSEAGGHRGTFLADYASSMVSTLPLVRDCVLQLQVPVIAAGSIMDGAGIAAALALGAQAVQMGTAFLVCPESAINTAYRAALAGAQATDTVTTRTISGRPARGIRNAMIDALEADEAAIPPYPVQNALTGALRKLAGAAGDAQYLSLWAGQGVAQARALPAAQLLQKLKEEWLAAGAQ
ncbi:nitronate monooxygenase [Comamonas sp. BIGb0152]|uniref:NAD(P)H-dependent flavin oxidoreductase n=1 Tax=Comamonas sp. BIGb0152 TaxID=2940601 RepID=UPI002169BAF0|nr:nitronate monooxygenase family protein [Comamonas sp. BIGb0152]MCS4294298.1 nitronate monooxygenase [Comamonas sp. BIGb0152]